jgi:hypothetical protein
MYENGQTSTQLAFFSPNHPGIQEAPCLVVNAGSAERQSPEGPERSERAATAQCPLRPELIEWAADQSWSTGSVGLISVSDLAMSLQVRGSGVHAQRRKCGNP